MHKYIMLICFLLAIVNLVTDINKCNHTWIIVDIICIIVLGNASLRGFKIINETNE